MSYTADQVKEAVSNYEDSEDNFDGWGSDLYSYIKGEGHYSHSDGAFAVEVPGIGKVEYVDDYGGEGQGDDYWVVFKTVETGQFWRVDGWYASYDGGELDGELYEVEPKEVTVTQYEAKK